MASTLRAGVACLELPVDLGLPMMGYGARRGTASGRHDPLFARALYLEREAAALVVECDLCLIAVSQASEIRACIAERTGLAREAILVGCTHTHSGPESGLSVTFSGKPAPAFVAPLLEVAVEVAVAARESARPARMAVGRTEAAIGRNRRREDAPIDRNVLVMRVDAAEGSPLAVMYVHGCHPTVLGHDNLAFSADWPGSASRAIERSLPGAMAMFLLGAHADVDPRTRGILDLAIPDQSVGVTFSEMEALGREVGEAVAKTAETLTPRDDFVISARSTRVQIPAHTGDLSAPEREACLARRRADALAALDLPTDAQAGALDLLRLERERTRHLPADEQRERLSRVRLYLRDLSSPRIAGGHVAEVEVQLLRLGPLVLLGLPIEVCVDVGLDWRARAEALGESHSSLVSIANGWLRYLPHRRNFEEPPADQGYEVLQSTFVSEAADRLLDAGERLLTAP